MLQRHRFNSAKGARLMLLLDGMLSGCIVAALGIAPLVFVAVLTALVISIRLIAPLHLLILVLCVFAASLAGASLWMGATLPPLPVGNELGAMLMLILYGGFISFLGFGETRGLARDSRQARAISNRHAELTRWVEPLLPRLPNAQTVAGDMKRREVSVVFADLVGFTALMDAGPEDRVTRALNLYLNQVVNVTYQHGGHINKFMGDGVMLLFGLNAGQTHQQTARQAVACAISMRAMMVPLSKATGLPFTVRIGIHSGYAAVGYVGSGERMEETAIGRAVNVASRLEQAAKPGSILISGETAGLVNQPDLCREVAPLHLKGISQPVLACEVVGVPIRAAAVRPG